MLVKELTDLAMTSKAPDIVITGGEPMLFPEAVARLCDGLRSWGRHVTIETNGTIYGDRVMPDLWSVSPKLESSAPLKPGPEQDLHAKNRGCTATLRRFVEGGRLQLKYVVATKKDIEEVERQVTDLGVAKSKVWLMPEGITQSVILERGAWLAEECKSRGYNLALRQHVLLWGHKRGV